jgi:hypothetical protein
MMLRPATPLSVLFLVAFALLLLSTLSTPVIKAIPIASFDGYDFGVWGFCKGDTCSSVQIGYNTGMSHHFHTLILGLHHGQTC